MRLIKRLWKRWTIRRRAQKLGCKLRESFPDFMLFSILNDKTKSQWDNTARTLTRLTKIKNGMPPFQHFIGWIGPKWDRVFISTSALQSYGNIRKDAPNRPFLEIGLYLEGFN